MVFRDNPLVRGMWYEFNNDTFGMKISTYNTEFWSVFRYIIGRSVWFFIQAESKRHYQRDSKSVGLTLGALPVRSCVFAHVQAHGLRPVYQSVISLITWLLTEQPPPPRSQATPPHTPVGGGDGTYITETSSWVNVKSLNCFHVSLTYVFSFFAWSLKWNTEQVRFVFTVHLSARTLWVHR